VETRAIAVLVAAVLTMSAAKLFDLATFVTMVNRLGPQAEANSLVGLLFGLYGYPMVAIVKVVLLALVSAVAAVLVRAPVRPQLAAAVLIVAILVGLAGGLSNSIALGAI
jgi:hypothetical protein